MHPLLKRRRRDRRSLSSTTERLPIVKPLIDKTRRIGEAGRIAVACAVLAGGLWAVNNINASPTNPNAGHEGFRSQVISGPTTRTVAVSAGKPNRALTSARVTRTPARALRKEAAPSSRGTAGRRYTRSSTGAKRPRGSLGSGPLATRARPIPVAPPTPDAVPPRPTAQMYPAAKAVSPPQTPEQLAQQHDRIEAISRLPHDASHGCEQITESSPTSLPIWGPPAPRVYAQLVNTDVIVNFEFDELEGSAGCRPMYVDAVVLAHDENKMHRHSSVRVLIDALRGSLSVALPPGAGPPPYYLRVRALAEDLRPSREARIKLP